ncbi:hypothetical protein ACWC24_39855, partial [Streptomyces sp. NPDC001443]
MFCTTCGRPGAPGESYCARCGNRLNQEIRITAPPSLTLRYLTSGLGAGAAACVVIAICTTYSFAGPDALPTTLHDNDGTLAFNIAHAVILSLGSLLALLRGSARLGLGLAGGAGIVYPSLLVADVVGMFRSGAQDTLGYIAPGFGFYCGIASAVLAAAAAVCAVTALRRSGDLQVAPTKTSALWAVIALLSVVGCIGENEERMSVSAGSIAGLRCLEMSVKTRN